MSNPQNWGGARRSPPTRQSNPSSEPGWAHTLTHRASASEKFTLQPLSIPPTSPRRQLSPTPTLVVMPKGDRVFDLYHACGIEIRIQKKKKEKKKKKNPNR